MIEQLAKEKAYSQRHIHTYRQRREQYKVKYGKETEKYRKLSRQISFSIHSLKKKIKRIDVKRAEVERIKKGVEEFMDVSLPSIEKSEKIFMAKRLYYKYGMESGINGYYLRSLMNDGKHTPGKYRLSFTRSFSKKPENKALWKRFKVFMENNEVIETPLFWESPEKIIEVYEKAKTFVNPKNITDWKLTHYLFYRWGMEKRIDDDTLRAVTNQQASLVVKAREEYKEYFNKEYNTIKFNRRKKWEEFKESLKDIVPEV